MKHKVEYIFRVNILRILQSVETQFPYRAKCNETNLFERKAHCVEIKRGKY